MLDSTALTAPTMASPTDFPESPPSQAFARRVHIGFSDFARDREFFGERILPLMKRAGLRIDISQAARGVR